MRYIFFFVYFMVSWSLEPALGAVVQVALVGFALYASRLQGARVQPQPLLG